MKYKVKSIICCAFLVGLSLAGGRAMAQTLAYRQINLTGSSPGLADNVIPGLLNPWGMTYLPGNPFFIANTNSGRVIAQPLAGMVADLPGFIVVNPDNTTPGTPTGIVSDANSFFGSTGVVQPFITATLDGGVYYWGLDANGDIATAATLAVDHFSSGAVYTGLAILSPTCCNPFLVVANFHTGEIETYTPTFAPLAAPGNFLDPDLPADYAPFGIQVIGSQVFITYAVQDAARRSPVFGAGNGIVDVFDLEGNFVKRFVTGGELNAPWGVAVASANFGPFSNDVLVGNAGDGVVNAFDPASGEFRGKIRNGDDNLLANAGLHALTFRNDGVGDPDTLYFAAGLSNGSAGLFASISTGLVSKIQVSVPDTPNNTSATFTTNVTPGPGNSGSPTGSVEFKDGNSPVGTAPVVEGAARLTATLSGVGDHAIEGRYSGDDTFLPSTGLAAVHVTGPVTMTTLEVPANAPAGSPVTLRATTTSAAGNPTGTIDFLDGNDRLGAVPLNAAGVATLTTSNLAGGIHTVVAGYSGDRNFESSVSAPETITISAGDFQLGTNASDATVSAGQSARFTLTLTPSGGFAETVSFSCQAPTGFGCGFDPPSVNTATGASSTILTVTTPSNATAPPHSHDLNDTMWRLLALTLTGLALLWHTQKNRTLRKLNLALAAGVITMIVTFASCGGSGQSSPVAPRSNAIVVTGRSGSIAHATTLNITVR